MAEIQEDSMIADFADVLETLFWFVIVIIWIVSQFWKHGKKGKDISGPALSKSDDKQGTQKR